MKNPASFVGDLVTGVRSSSASILRTLGSPMTLPAVVHHEEAPTEAPKPVALAVPGVDPQIVRLERTVASLSTFVADSISDLTNLIGRCVWRAEDTTEKTAASLSTQIETVNSATGIFFATVIDEMAGMKVASDVMHDGLKTLNSTVANANLAPAEILDVPSVATLDAYVGTATGRVMLVGETRGSWHTLDVDWGDDSAVETYGIDWANVAPDSPIRTQAHSIFEPSSGQLLTYSYSKPGVYVISVTIANAYGVGKPKKVQVNVKP